LPSLQEVPFGSGVVVHPVVVLQPSVVQALPSLHTSGVPAVQEPLWHDSAPLHTFASRHGVPLVTGAVVQPVVGLQLSVVHGLPSLQTSGVPEAQTPFWQVSAPLQTVESAHAVPFRTGVFTHPLVVLQVSVVQTLLSLQLSAVPGVQLPLWQVSAPLQALPSEQDVPLATTLFAQTPALQTSVVHGLPSLQSAFTAQDWQPEIGVFTHPDTALQVSVVQALPSLQLGGVPPVQVPVWQVSAPLQAFPSEHDVPLVTAMFTHPVAVLQLSVVQTLLSLQSRAVPAVHVALWHVSAPLQALPSEHEVPLARGVFTQPVVVLHVSVVQALLSLQLGAAPEAHVPDWQVSTPLQALPSEHDEPLATATFWQPASGSQLSVVQTLPSLQLSGVPAEQMPAWQVSAPSQTSPSAHEVPFGTGAFTQPDVALQLSVVQSLLSLQLGGAPAVHDPLWQVSTPLQALPSLHEEPFASAVFTQPVAALHVSEVQTLLSLQLGAVPAEQVPLWQVSAPLQALPSEHDVPLASAVFTQPVAVLQESAVQALLSLQLGGVPAVQAPFWHVSAPLQAFPSAHGVPFVTGVLVHPLDGLQASVVQTFASLQSSGVPAVQVPATQVSAPLQALPSEHDVPFVTGVAVHPVAALQPSVVHGLPSLHVSGVPAVHVPPWQVSPPLQALPSEHDEPFATAGFWQPAIASQVSLVHGFPSLQLSGVPAAQVPLWHVSAPLQAFPSAHDVPFATGVAVHPVAGLQPSVVHGFPSLHVGGVPAVQVPLWHVSAPLQASPSEQEVPFATTLFEQTPALQTSVVQGLPSLQSPFTLHDWQPAIGVFTQPEPALHVSVVQALLSLQLGGVPPVQVPVWHVSAPLQALPSLHEVPFVTAVFTQPVDVLQLSVVHTFASLQSGGVPGVQAPLRQVSAPLQALPSAHDAPFATGVFTQPVDVLQLSVVHTLLSLQLGAVPEVHVPLWQVSLPLQAFPSEQEEPFVTGVFTHPVDALHESVVQTLPSLQLGGDPAVQVPL
jgi:hypothetical protein